ncbi:MAG: hypothetical protein AB1724_12800 [Thermodesulfobacteriota bacterium]
MAWPEEHINYIINETKSLKKRLAPIFKDEPQVITDNWEPVARYLLGDDNNAIDNLTIEEINMILSDILVSLRYPASAPPMNLPTPNVDISEVFNRPDRLFFRINNFFDQFDGSSSSSILGRFYSLLQKELLKHFCASDKYTTYCAPITIGGNRIGLLAYFPEAIVDLSRTNDFDSFHPFKSHIMSDNARDYYRSFNNSFIPGAVILYFYSAETNSFFLTSGKGFLTFSCFKQKEDIKTLRNIIAKGHTGSSQKRTPAAGTQVQLESEEMKTNLYKVLRMAQYCCLQSFETKKNYANAHIQEKIACLEVDTVPFHLIFELLSWFVPFSAAVLWGRGKNKQWTIRERQIYAERPEDRLECRLKLISDDGLSDFENKYKMLMASSLSANDHDLTTIFNNRKPVIQDLDADIRLQLADLFGYSGKIWAWSLDCVSRFIIPVNDPDVPETILEIYFNEEARWLNIIIHDMARMIARLYAILKEEFGHKRLAQEEMRRRYIGKLSHEIRNWFPQVNRRVEELERIVAAGAPADQLDRARENIGFARVRLKYFSDIFDVVLSEVRSKKYGLHKDIIALDKVMTEVKEGVIDLCIHDINYRYRLAKALDIPDSQAGSDQLKNLLRQNIHVRQTGLMVYENETLIFTCLQEMLKNAVSKQDWANTDGFIMEARNIGTDRLGLRVTNLPRRERQYLTSLVDYSRSLVEGDAFENEGFGSLWLKSIRDLLHGEFTVPPEWLVRGALSYPSEFWLEIIISGKAEAGSILTSDLL